MVKKEISRCSIRHCFKVGATETNPYPQGCEMKRLFLCISTMFILWGCAELDHAGDVVLREVSSINVDNPETHEDVGALPEDWGEDVDDGNP